MVDANHANCVRRHTDAEPPLKEKTFFDFHKNFAICMYSRGSLAPEVKFTPSSNKTLI